MSEPDQFPQKKVLAIYAEDWSIDDGPIDINHSFPLYKAWIVGFLIRETEDSITVTMEIFGEKARHAQTIPKSAIRICTVLKDIK